VESEPYIGFGNPPLVGSQRNFQMTQGGLGAADGESVARGDQGTPSRRLIEAAQRPFEIYLTAAGAIRS